MDNRRDFLKKASLFVGGIGLGHSLPLSIQKALAINPDRGTTFEDAEHVVLLMQENRSFDHVFGSLQGVRGFNDPRAITLPNGNKAWFQKDYNGDSYAPFRLDLKGSKSTWMGSLPHDWESMVDARNYGRYDNWLIAKRPERKYYSHLPLSLGYYNREDLPFYYALADAFTVGDHHFCSSLTATTPNRLFFWTGTVRERPEGDAPANLHTEDVYYNSLANWTTFPERLEKENISWKIYQNELSLEVGFEGEEDSWLANFTDNDLEWFSQYHVRFHPAHYTYMKKRVVELKREMQQFQEGSEERKKRERLLKKIEDDLIKYNPEDFNRLPQFNQRIHAKAFTTNINDPDYHTLETLKYEDGGIKKEVEIPRGDILDQFRKDVKNGQLPTVSWLVPPARCSDHPGSPWYGAWYVSEVLNILTENPEVWKKTIFILTYDENDGYFDHLPPFTAPDPEDAQSGRCSTGIDTHQDYVTQSQADRLKGKPKDPRRVSPIGLGYRVPFIIASPWSRGGYVNSEISDNTSTLMFLEKFLAKKTAKAIREENISAWRRTICSDLTSFFRPYNGEKIIFPESIDKDKFVKSIYNAKFKEVPSLPEKLSEAEIRQFDRNPYRFPKMPVQEAGIRPSNALSYELYVSGDVLPGQKKFQIKMKALNSVNAASSLGTPFTIYNQKEFQVRNYAVKKGDELSDHFDILETYHFSLYGPNGFFRSFKGEERDPEIELDCVFERKRLQSDKFTGNIVLKLKCIAGSDQKEIEMIDRAYGSRLLSVKVEKGKEKLIVLNLKKSFGWYDFIVRVKGNEVFERGFAGHVETGTASFTDPHMGRVDIRN